MKWVEIITLRCFAKTEREFVDEFLNLVRRQKGAGFPESIAIYRHLVVETDLSIHMRWETATKPLCESFLGQQIAYTLKNHGLLNHSIWIEDWNLV